MPKMSDTMTEGVIANWLKNVGDKVKSGDMLAEIETDKATMEYEAYESGTLLYIGAEKGQSVAVDDLLCVIGEAGADFQALVAQFKAQQGGGSATPMTTTATQTEPTQTAAITSNGQSDDHRFKISPLAKKLAQDKGIDLKQVKGSGDNGRIVKRDIENFVPSSAQSTKVETTQTSSTASVALGQESFEEVPVSQMRKTIARRLSESKFTAPHFYLTMEINMDEAIPARERLNEISPVKISFNDMVIKASAMALKKHPAVNAAWLGDKIRYNHHVHVGVAVAVDEGLLVPVIRFADQKSLSQIAAEVKDLAGKAKNKKLQPAEWSGNTFSVSNLGMFGIDEFTAIINPPDACILAVGSIKQTAIVKDGQLVIGNIMKVTLSCDHRVVDGASGAAFLKTMKELLESPVKMLV
jgi:pyruvate dehydrogenase E2 component (dihydrolipoamide acetyltransferase)